MVDACRLDRIRYEQQTLLKSTVSLTEDIGGQAAFSTKSGGKRPNGDKAYCQYDQIVQLQSSAIADHHCCGSFAHFAAWALD